MAIHRIAIGSPGEAGQPDAIRAAFAEFFSMLIFVFAGQGSGMAYSESSTYSLKSFYKLFLICFIHSIYVFNKRLT